MHATGNNMEMFFSIIYNHVFKCVNIHLAQQ